MESRQSYRALPVSCIQHPRGLPFHRIKTHSNRGQKKAWPLLSADSPSPSTSKATALAHATPVTPSTPSTSPTAIPHAAPGIVSSPAVQPSASLGDFPGTIQPAPLSRPRRPLGYAAVREEEVSWRRSLASGDDRGKVRFGPCRDGLWADHGRLCVCFTTDGPWFRCGMLTTAGSYEYGTSCPFCK